MSDPPNAAEPLLSNALGTPCPRRTGLQRRRRILHEDVTWFGPMLDFLFGAGPWLLAVGVAAAVLTAVIEYTEGTGAWMRDNLANQAAITALSSMLSFLVVSRISANLSQNSAVVGMFGGLCGSTIGMALNLRGLAKQVRDEQGCTGKLSLVIASLPHAAYYKAAGYSEFDQVDPDNVALPICDDKSKGGAYSDFVKIQTATRLPVFETLVLMATKYIQTIEGPDNLQVPKVGTIMKGLNDVATAEGNLNGTLSFKPARIIDIVIYMLFILYYLLLLIAELVPQSSWSSIWVSMIVVLSTAGLYGISARLKNPFLDRGGGQNQRSGLRETVLSTERQVIAAMDSLEDIRVTLSTSVAIASVTSPK